MSIPAKVVSSNIGPYDILPAPSNLLVIIIQGCAPQNILLPSAVGTSGGGGGGSIGVTVEQIVQRINNVLVGAVASVTSAALDPEGDGKIKIETNLATSEASIRILPTLAAQEIGFLAPNDQGFGSDSPPPVVVTVEPPCYLVSGGIYMTVTGSGFLPGVKVFIGSSLELQFLELISESEIKGVIPPGIPGTFDVVVRNADTQIFTVDDAFTYVPIQKATLLSVSPSSGPVVGGTLLTITGTAFTLQMNFRLGAQDAANIVIQSPTQASCVTPAGAIGFVDLTAVSVANDVALLENAFEYLPLPVPDALALNPNVGPLAGGIRVDAHGTNFYPGISVRFGANESTDVVFVTSDKLDVLLPPGDSVGLVDVFFTNVDGGQDRLVNGFKYVDPPAIMSIVPNSGYISGGTPVRILGSAFQVGAKILFDNLYASDVMVLSPSEIICLTPAHPIGVVNVQVVNPEGQNFILINGYTYLPLPDHVQVGTDAICEVQNFDILVNNTLQCVQSCKDRADQLIPEIDKRLSPYGEPDPILEDVVAGAEDIHIRSELVKIGDSLLLYDDDRPTGEILNVIRIEPLEDFTFTVVPEVPVVNAYSVAKNGRVKRINLEYGNLNDVLTVVPSFRDAEDLLMVKAFLQAYSEFVEENLDPNM